MYALHGFKVRVHTPSPNCSTRVCMDVCTVHHAALLVSGTGWRAHGPMLTCARLAQVTSVELLPIDFVASSLKQSMPSIIHAVGDGSVLVPELVKAATKAGERVAVIFDGEKRHKAYKTYKTIADKVHLAVFDDSFHERFHNFLDAHAETAWHTNLDSSYMGVHGPGADMQLLEPFENTLRIAAKSLLHAQPQLRLASNKKERHRLVDDKGRLNLPPGGLQNMAYYHFVLVRGGAWRDGDEVW